MKIALPLAGVMTFFMGILQVGEKAGAIHFLARRIRPFFTRLFPEIPQDPESRPWANDHEFFSQFTWPRQMPLRPSASRRCKAFKN
jgi:hypothetical protein